VKKKFAITAAIITTMITVIFCLSQPKDIISGTNGYQIDRVVYNGVDVTQRVDREALASFVSKYKCSRFPRRFAPYQESQVVVELNGVSGDSMLHILLGDINLAYKDVPKGYFIKNSKALFNEILEIMPDLSDEDLGLRERKAFTFADGKSADLWRPNDSGSDVYKLSDGTTLLTIQDPTGPDNVYVVGRESFDDLSESAKRAVSEYYKKQGLLYDTRSEVENAYTEYLACKESGKEYHERNITQDIAPTASNDTIMCFLTSVYLPVNGQTAQEISRGAVFDRNTGKVRSIWDLFALPEEEVRQWLFDAFHVDSSLRAEMEAALKPEYIALFPDNLSVTFPQGSLPSQEYSWSFGFTYKDLKAVLQPLAIPDN